MNLMHPLEIQQNTSENTIVDFLKCIIPLTFMNFESIKQFDCVIIWCKLTDLRTFNTFCIHKPNFTLWITIPHSFKGDLTKFWFETKSLNELCLYWTYMIISATQPTYIRLKPQMHTKPNTPYTWLFQSNPTKNTLNWSTSTPISLYMI